MELYKIAERILHEVSTINYKTMAYKGQLTGRLIISVVSTGKYVMPYFLNKFLKQNEGVDLLMDVTNKLNVLKCLQNNEVDFALVSVLPHNLKVHEEILTDNELYLIGSRKQKIESKPITKNEMSKMPLIFREEGSGTRYVMETYFKKHNMQIRKKMELTSNEAVKQAVIAGLGNSIMPLIGLREGLLNGDLKIIPTVGFPIKSKWRLIWLKEKKMSPIAESYIAYLKNNKESILKEHFSWMDKI
jgi:DNA-binding transcriptional LysR family regulator